MDRYLIHFLETLKMILSTVWGWITGLAVLVVNIITDHKIAITLTVIVVVLDLAWGIAASVKQKKFTTSELMRDTVSKLAVYGTAILTFCFLDKMLGESVTLTTVVICSVIMLVELWSILANALIVYPNMPFLKLLKPALAGEIANKLRIKPEEVKKAFGEDDETDNAAAQQQPTKPEPKP